MVNSARDPEYLLKFLPDSMRAKLAKFVVVDAVGLAEQRGSSPWMFVRDLGELAYDRMSTEGAEERLAIGMGIAAPLIGALVAATGELPVDGVAEQVADRDAMFRGVEQPPGHRVQPTVQATDPLTANRPAPAPAARRPHVRTRHPDPAAPAAAHRRRDPAARPRRTGQRLFPTGNFRFFRPVYKDKMPPCNNACPTGEQIQKYLDYVKHERYLDGYLTIMEDNPMPSVTGRVCYHPCETACNRAAARRADRHPQRGALPRRLRAGPAREPDQGEPARTERHHDRHRRLRPGRPGRRLPPAPPRLRAA